MEERPTILIVEDDPFYREFLVRTLEEDHEIRWAEEGDAVLELLERHDFAAVLCDLRIPGLSGEALVRAVRQKAGEETVLIVITGFDQDWSPVEATEARVYFYLKKGQFTPRELRKVLRNGLLLRRERMEKRAYADRLRVLNEELEKTVAERTRALRESEARYRNLFKQSLVGIYIQRDGRLLLVNDKFCEMTGRSFRELSGLPLEEVLVPAGTGGPGCGVGRPVGTVEEVRLRTRDGRELHALHCSGPIQARPDGTVQGCLLDITERKRLEQHLLQHQKMESLGTLVSGISHEFNNILAAMMPQAELLLRRAEQVPALQRSAQVILSMAEKASRFTRQLLNMSRRAEIEKRPIHVNAWIRESLGFLQPAMKEGCDIQVELDPLAGRVEGDPHQLDQVLLNLVINARDAIGTGGTIRISTAFRGADSLRRRGLEPREGSYVEITVEDTGCGIPPEHLPRIFDPFFTTKEMGQGTGLGLSTVYNLVKEHGGEILVESRVGEGSAFHVFLPHIAPAGREKGARTSAGRILVADNNPSVLDLFRNLLSQMKYEVIPVRDQQEAVEVYARRKEEIDCVILDGRFEETSNRSPVDRLLDLNPRIRMILTHCESERWKGLCDWAKDRGATIQPLALPITPEILSSSLKRVLHRGRSA